MAIMGFLEQEELKGSDASNPEEVKQDAKYGGYKADQFVISPSQYKRIHVDFKLLYENRAATAKSNLNPTFKNLQDTVYSHHPEVDAKSQKMAEVVVSRRSAAGPQTYYDQLIKSRERKVEVTQKVANELEERFKMEYTFKPSLDKRSSSQNPNSRRVINNNNQQYVDWEQNILNSPNVVTTIEGFCNRSDTTELQPEAHVQEVKEPLHRTNILYEYAQIKQEYAKNAQLFEIAEKGIEECTFRPARQTQNKPPKTTYQPPEQAKGVKELYDRLEAGRQEKNRLNSYYQRGLVPIDQPRKPTNEALSYMNERSKKIMESKKAIPIETNKLVQGWQGRKNLLLSNLEQPIEEVKSRSKQQALFYLDVNIGSGKTSRITVMPDDDPEELANKFARQNRLDLQSKQALVEAIQQQIQLHKQD